MKAMIFCGDRNWDDPVPIQRMFDKEKPDLILEGEARGADKLSRREARLRGIDFEMFDADWDRYGRAAGPIRNREMLLRLIALEVEGWEVAVAAFHSNLENSKGTKNMVEIAKVANIRVEVVA
jgi:hypothetical protein